MAQTILDRDFGEVSVLRKAAARRIIFRYKEGRLVVTAPASVSVGKVREAIEQSRPRLFALRADAHRTRIDLNFRISTDFFRLSLVRGTSGHFLSKVVNGEQQLICPPETDWNDDELQNWLHGVVKELLRKHAKRLLLPRLEQLSKLCGLPYACGGITSSQGRWGSCSARGRINLSLYLLLLPARLIDYVLIHELCHTREMNHGERFWALVDSFTEGRAHALRAELRNYRPEL